MTTHTTARPGTTFSLDERVLTVIAVLGVVVLLLPSVAPLATGGSPGYYLYEEYGTSDSADDSLREDGAAAGTAGSAMTAGGTFAYQSASSAMIAYGGGAVATGGIALAVVGGILIG